MQRRPRRCGLRGPGHGQNLAAAFLLSQSGSHRILGCAAGRCHRPVCRPAAANRADAGMARSRGRESLAAWPAVRHPAVDDSRPDPRHKRRCRSGAVDVAVREQALAGRVVLRRRRHSRRVARRLPRVARGLEAADVSIANSEPGLPASQPSERCGRPAAGVVLRRASLEFGSPLPGHRIPRTSPSRPPAGDREGLSGIPGTGFDAVRSRIAGVDLHGHAAVAAVRPGCIPEWYGR